MIGVRRDEKQVSASLHNQGEKSTTSAGAAVPSTSKSVTDTKPPVPMSSSVAMPSTHPASQGAGSHNKNSKYRSSYQNLPQYSYHADSAGGGGGGGNGQQQPGKRRNHGNAWNWPKKQASAKPSIDTVKCTPKDVAGDKHIGKATSSPPPTKTAAVSSTQTQQVPQLSDRKAVDEEPVPTPTVVHRPSNQTKAPSPSRRSPNDCKDGTSNGTSREMGTQQTSTAATAAANHYPNELLKVIRDKMNGTDDAQLWAILNNIAGPLIIKTPPFAPGSPPPPPPAGKSTGGGGASFEENSVLLQAMEHNFIQNHPGYELLANAIFSNGGMLPSYFSDPLLTTLAPPPPIGVPLSVAVAESLQAKVGPPGGSPVQHNNARSGAAYHSQQDQQQGNYQRMPPGSSSASEGNQRQHAAYSPPLQQQIDNQHYQQQHQNGNGMAFNNNNAPLSPNGGFFINGPMFVPRPKNFWNFCVNCKKSQYCPIHHNNYNSSASAIYTHAHGNLIAVPNCYVPEYYQQQQQRSYHNPYYGHYHHHHHHYGNNNNYQHHKRNHHHGGGGGGGGGRRQFNNSNRGQGHFNGGGGGGGVGNKNNRSPPNTPRNGEDSGSVSPKSRSPVSPKTISPVPTEVDVAVTPTEATNNQSSSSSSASSASSAAAPKENGTCTSASQKNGHQKRASNGSGKKRVQRFTNDYESDTSSSKSNGGDFHVNRFNYGLVENMKLWHQDPRKQAMTGDLGPHQLMSPTNHPRFSVAPPLLVTVVEGQRDGGGGAKAGGGGGEEAGSGSPKTTTAQPVIQQDELDLESAYWSSVFPFATAGASEEGVQIEVSEGTPADKYLANSHLMETVETPKELLEGVSRDPLSQQIWNTFLTVQQTQETYKKKLVIWKFLYACIKKVFPRLSVYLVGSTITGFGAKTSDVDMCVVSKGETELDPRVEAVLNLTDIKKFLSSSDAFEEFHLIQAKVPILRFRDRANRIEVDLNYNNCVGIRNTQLLYCYSKLDWRVRPLVLVVKLWAKYQDINNAKNMTISSYSLALMVINFLQCGVTPSVLPCLHTMFPEKFQNQSDVNEIDMNEDLGGFESENNLTLGELLLRFLYYYSNFDYNNLAVSVRTGSCVFIDDCRYVRSPKNDPQQWKNLCIEEPFDFTNTARSVYDAEIFHQIKYVFVQSYNQLQQTLDLGSILKKKFINFPVNHFGFGPGAFGGSQHGRGQSE